MSFALGAAGLDYGSIFGGVQGEVTSAISSVAPLGVAVFGIVLAVGIGIKVFGKLAKKG
jgi:hypothetical protein